MTTINRLATWVRAHRLAACIGAQSSDSVEQLHTVSKRRDAKLLQVLVRQARENRLVYVILAEDRLVLAEARLRSQTTTSMMAPPTHGLPGIMVLPRGGV